MTYINFDDVVAQLKGAGFDIRHSDVEPCKWRRRKIDGMTQKGWFTLHEMPMDDGQRALTGSYGWWVGAEQFVFKIEINIDSKRAKLTAEQREAQKALWAAEKAAEQARQIRKQERAAQQASVWWRKLHDAGESGYMAKKGFNATDLFGARVSPAGNLVVPVQDITGKTWGLQVISATKNKHGRDKDFTPPGLAKKGHFFQMGVVARGGVVLLCEGFATGASLRAATGLPVVVAFDAGNLTPVAMAIHKAHRKDVRILVCADDDYKTMLEKGFNPGVDAANTAALAVDGLVVAPQFPGDRPTDRKGPTDFNDLHVHPDGGLQAVRVQIEAALATAGWAVSRRTVRAGIAQQGGGEKPQDGRRRAEAVMPLDDIVARFVPLDDGTGKYVFDLWTNKVANRDQMTALLPAGVRGDDIKRHPIWQERGAYFLDEVGFDPSGKDCACKLNTWKGWPMQPKAGSCEELLALLYHLCSADPNASEIYEWVLRWMAYPLQHPGAKMSSAIIMHGPQGTGKSTVWQCLAKIYGDYATVLNQRGLEDRFNSDWVDSKLFILAEEVVTRAEMWHIKNELKELITGEWIRVNPKNIAAYRQRNQVNGVFLSNENQPLPLDNDDRRHCVIYTPPALRESDYDRVHLEIERGGVEALYQYLLDLDLGDFHPKKRPPMTEAKAALIALSSPSEYRFVHEWASGELGLPVCPAKSTDVYAAYLRWCRLNGEARPRPSNQFHGALARMAGWSKTKARIYADMTYSGDSVPTPLIIPPESAIVNPALRKVEGHAEAVWHTNGAVMFAEAVKGDSWSGKVAA